MPRVLVSKNTFAGEVRVFAGASAPVGFLECDGRPVSITDFPQLYNAIGTTHGDGSKNADGTASGFSGTHFNLPDYRGRFLRGVDGLAGRDGDKAGRLAPNAGGLSGNNVGSVQGDQFGSHSHRVKNADTVVGGPGTNGYIAGSTFNSWQANAEASGGSETRPKNANVLYCIKY